MKNNIKKGRLTIYTSYSPGAGKTHIMLRDALQNYGEKVVIGFLNGKERKIKGSNIKPVHHYSLEKIVSKFWECCDYGRNGNGRKMWGW